MANEKLPCNQLCRWNDPSDGCIKPTYAVCPLSNTEPDASGWGQVQANEKRLIDANALMDEFRRHMAERFDRERCGSEENCKVCEPGCLWRKKIMVAPTVDAVEVVRCQDCVHAEPLDRNCELSTCHYMHCKLYRGDETKNVWHKYKKYYKDYSLVERDGFCSDGAKMDGDGDG